MSSTRLLRIRSSDILTRKSYLLKLGLNEDQIAGQPQLLSNTTKTIQNHYEKIIGFFRQDYRDRSSGRELVAKYSWLLAMSPATVEAMFQYLSSHSLNYRKDPLVLGSSSQARRRKVAFLLRQVFDYQNLPEELRKEAIERTYALLRERPQLLVASLSSLEKQKLSLRELYSHIPD